MSTASHAATTRPKRSRKPFIVIAALALLLVGGGTGAYAFWSITGTGTGSAATGNPASTLTVNQTSSVSGMGPGAAAQTLSGTFSNPNSGPVYVTNVVVGTITVLNAQGAVATGCDSTDFTVAGGTMAVKAEVPSGSSKGAWTGATVAFNDKATNQDACKGTTLSIAYTSN
ncbi:hypothetical protein [Frondihabitans cladoniiphilus]